MGWSTKYTGEQIDAALEKGNTLKVANNGWIRLESSSANPTNLGSLRNPGNFITSFWTDGPDFGDETITPINITNVRINGNLHQFITAGTTSFVRVLVNNESGYGNWTLNQSDNAINIGPSAPMVSTDSTSIWLDTVDATSPVLKLFINGEWVDIVPENSMLSNVYDPQGKKTDIFDYIDNSVSNISSGSIKEIDTHISDTTVHVTVEDKAKIENVATESDINVAVNTMKASLESDVEREISSHVSKITNLQTEADAISDTLSQHSANAAIHPSTEKQTAWSNKADGNHTHNLDGRVTITPENIEGIISSDKLPYDVKERVYVVSTEDDLYALTKNPIHNGDIIGVESENGNVWYFVVDDSYLGAQGIDTSWKENNMGTPNRYWSSICYGNGKFVAIGAATSDYLNDDVSIIAYSYDAITWTEIPINNVDIGALWNSICYGNGKFVAVSYDNYFAYSTDAINWVVDYARNASKDMVSICYGDGKFVACASGDKIAISTDGISWSDSEIPSGEWSSVCYGGGKFIAVDSTGQFAYSYDAITWVADMIIPYQYISCQSVCYGNGKYVAIIRDADFMAYSTDGITWDNAIMPYYDWYSVCYGNGMFVAIARNNANFAYSIDGMLWEEGTISDTLRAWHCICYANGKYITLAQNSNVSATATLEPNSAKAFKKFSASNTDWSSVVNTPTTLAGYGITDAVTKEEYAVVEAEVAQISSAIPSEVDLSNTAEAHTIYTTAVNDLTELDAAIVAMDDVIAKVEAIAR